MQMQKQASKQARERASKYTHTQPHSHTATQTHSTLPIHKHAIVVAPHTQPLSTQDHMDIGKITAAATIASRVLRRHSSAKVESSGRRMRPWYLQTAHLTQQ